MSRNFRTEICKTWHKKWMGSTAEPMEEREDSENWWQNIRYYSVWTAERRQTEKRGTELWDVCDDKTKPGIRATWVPEGERKEWLKITWKCSSWKFPKFCKIRKPTDFRSLVTPNKIKAKTPLLSHTNFWKLKTNENILKATERNTTTPTGKRAWMTVNLSSETKPAIRAHFSSAEKELSTQNCIPRETVYPASGMKGKSKHS